MRLLRLITGNVRSDIVLFPATAPKPLDIELSYAVTSLAHEIKYAIQRKFPHRKILDNILVTRRGNDNCEVSLLCVCVCVFFFLKRRELQFLVLFLRHGVDLSKDSGIFMLLKVDFGPCLCLRSYHPIFKLTQLVKAS